jgi:hypothetical protein
MRRIVVTGLAIICVIIIGSMAATREPRSAVIEAAPTQNPQPVAVTNFPAVQGVTGTVNVGNLPAVQTVTGTIAVGNLPLDVNGNIRVAGTLPLSPATIHFIGITQATLPWSTGSLPFSRACSAEFPGTRMCDQIEALRSIPAPEWPLGVEFVLVSYEYIGGGGVHLIDTSALTNAGVLTTAGSPPTMPVACCGF